MCAWVNERPGTFKIRKLKPHLGCSDLWMGTGIPAGELVLISLAKWASLTDANMFQIGRLYMDVLSMVLSESCAPP